MNFEWAEEIGWLRRIKGALAFRHRMGGLCSVAPKLGLVPPPPRGRRPGISAMMRLKNESRWIEPVLRSLAPFVDQFSIVDNGSTDGTADIIHRVAGELALDYTLETLPTGDFGEVCDRALANTACRWVLRWDGDMIARTSGPDTLWRLRDFALSLDPDRYYAIYFPHIQLDGDLFHQDPDHLIHYEDYLFTWSPRLAHTRTGRYREIRYPLYYKRLSCWETSSFHLNGLDSPEAMITRKYWTDWRHLNDFVRYPSLRDYASERIRAEYGTDSLAGAGARYIRERCARFVPYDRGRFGEYPELLAPYLDTFPLRLVVRDGKIAGRSDVMDTLDRLDAAREHHAVDVIIPTRNREPHALATAESLLAQDYPRFRVLVIDQSDVPSEALRLLAVRDPRLVYEKVEPRGLPAARNEGIRRSGADIVVFVDDDVVLDPGFIAAHAREYADATVAAVAGKIVERDAPDAMLPRGRMGTINFWTGALHRGYTEQEPRDVTLLPGGNMSFRRETLLACGGFDERFGGAFLFEETDVSLALRKRGCRVRYAPDAALLHLRASNGGCRTPDQRREIYWYAHNFMLLFLKHFPRRAFPGWFALRAGKLCRDALRTRSLVPLIWGFRGFRDGARHSHRTEQT